MVGRDENGKITLSWAQAVWSITIIATVIGCYYGIQIKIDRIGYVVTNNTLRIEELERRNRNVGFAQRDAQQMRDELDAEIARLRKYHTK